MILSYKDFKLMEAGQAAGTDEVAKTPLAEARKFANDLFEKYQKKSLDEVLPDFDKHYLSAQALAKKGQTVRKDMPVIDEKDVRNLQNHLKNGELDVNAPFDEDYEDNPFPEGLTGEMAKDWLDAGLPDKDKGPKSDDKVKCSEVRVKCGSLTPIQKQIYLDKCLTATAQNGVKDSIKFLESSVLIISSDGHIIDGHHRWMSATMIDPNIMMHALKIDLSIDKLLPLCLAYGDAVGNARNQ